MTLETFRFVTAQKSKIFVGYKQYSLLWARLLASLVDGVYIFAISKVSSLAACIQGS